MKKVLLLVLALVMLCSLCVFFTACGDEETGAKSITNLTYNGETISWTPVKNAKNYKISINGGSFIVPQAEGTVTYRYDCKGAEYFDFSIEAVIKEGSDKNPTYSMQFVNIGQVEGLRIEGGNLVWNSLQDAEKYEIMYNGDIVPASVGTNSYAASVGAFTYKVRGLKGQAESADGNIPYFSVWSEALQGTVLAAPVNLKYDSAVFTWDKVEGATGYVVKIGSEEVNVTTNRYEFAAGNENFTVCVAAKGNETTKVYDSPFSEAKEYVYVEPVSGIVVEDGGLKWNASEQAVGYKIKINGVVENEVLTTNSYNKISGGNSIRVQVMPVGSGDFWFSHWSEEVTINLLHAPSGLKYSDGVLRWEQVYGCSGYGVKIEKNGEVIDTKTFGAEEFTYNYAFDEAGEYLVYVKATAMGGGGVYESKYSAAYSVKRLATPTGASVVSNPTATNQVAVTFNPSVGAVSYALLADGVEVATVMGNNTTFSVDVSKLTVKQEESVVAFRILAKGGVSTDGAVLDCKVPLEFNVTKTAVPQNLTINGDQLSWESVNQTSKYIVSIDGQRTELTTNSYTITNLSAGNHVIYVQAMGNGQNVITSSFSAPLEVNKLATPGSLHIENGILTWGIVQGATAYKVKLGNETYNADGNAFDLAGYNSYIAEGQGTQISVFAIGNGSNVINSNASATRTISKYNRPSAVKVTGDSLVWNPSSVNSINCNTYLLKITKNGQETTVRMSGTAYSMENFEPGTYTVEVIALGDNVSTLDSPASTSYTFKKLASISQVYKNGTTYSWDAIPDASGYEIKMSKDATWIPVSTNSYEPTFTTEGVFEVSIRAISTDPNTANSEIYSFSQRVNRFTQPVAQEAMTNANAFKVQVSGNQIQVTMKKPEGATGTALYVGGIDRSSQATVYETSTEITYVYTMTTVGASYAVQVQVKGGCFVGDNFMMDSNKSTEYSVVYSN